MFIFIIVFIFHVYKSESVYTDRNCGLTSVLSVGKKALSDCVFIDLSWKSLAHNHTLLNKTSFTLKCTLACTWFNLSKGAMKSILPYTAETTLNFARTVILIVVLKSAIIWIRTRLLSVMLSKSWNKQYLFHTCKSFLACNQTAIPDMTLVRFGSMTNFSPHTSAFSSYCHSLFWIIIITCLAW